MEETKKQEGKDDVGKELTGEQVGEVAGGDGSCTSTVTVSGNPSISNTAGNPSDALIGMYDGMVDATSHVIETVAKAIKQS
jgi:hypothetical protein